MLKQQARRLGRPHTLDRRPKLLTAIAASVANGLPIKYAAARHGLHPSTLHRWIANGATDEPATTPEGRAYLEITRARAMFVERTLRELDERAEGVRQGAWTASAWKLERLLPNDFGRNRTDPSDEALHDDRPIPFWALEQGLRGNS